MRDIEVLSPSTAETDRVVKSEVYARQGVPSYWIADPEEDRLILHRLELPEARYVVVADLVPPAIAKPEELEGLSIDLDEVFGRT